MRFQRKCDIKIKFKLPILRNINLFFFFFTKGIRFIADTNLSNIILHTSANLISYLSASFFLSILAFDSGLLIIINLLRAKKMRQLRRIREKRKGGAQDITQILISTVEISVRGPGC